MFFREVDGAFMSVFVELGACEHGPAPSHPMRSMIRVPLQNPNKDGLRRPEELQPMGALEDRLTAAVARELDGWFVGRTMSKGSCVFVYYHPREPPGRLILAEPWAPYQPSAQVFDDPTWSYLLEFLAPSEFERQTWESRRLLLALEQRGDRHDLSRVVDHVALFQDTGAALEAADGLRAVGFAVDQPRKQGGEVVLEFHREDALAGLRPDEFVREILDVLARHAGRYDGWGAPITR